MLKDREQMLLYLYLPSALLEKFWLISLYLTEDSTYIYSKALCDVKFRLIEEYG